MKPLRLYLQDFMCYRNTMIDFSKFQAALIMAKQDGNENVSNGMGKTTIFRAIEYVLFSHTPFQVDKVIRDDADKCAITFDFEMDGAEYRICRKRSKKKNSDFSLYVRTQTEGKVEEVYHQEKEENGQPLFIPIFNELYWKNLTASRIGDTGIELEKILPFNVKSFRSTSHFVQHDFSGLATSTSTARKGILKEALDLIVYSKLEKIAKGKFDLLNKEIEKQRMSLSILGNPIEEVVRLGKEKEELQKTMELKRDELDYIQKEFHHCSVNVLDFANEINEMEGKFSDLVAKEKVLIGEKNKLEASVKDYGAKKTNASSSAKSLISEIAALKEKKETLSKIDFDQIITLESSSKSKVQEIADLNAKIKTNSDLLAELLIPLPDDNTCKHCRQPTSPEHRENCLREIEKEKSICNETIKLSKSRIQTLMAENTEAQKKISSLKADQKSLETTEISITAKEKEIKDKRALFEEYSALLSKFTEELEEKKTELSKVQEDLQNSSLEESKKKKEELAAKKRLVSEQKSSIDKLTQEIADLNRKDGALDSRMKEQEENQKKQGKIKEDLEKIENEASIYPEVIQSFSSTGIPNLIIQNVLDDLQIESNLLLEQIRPGLQLSFSVAKDDGDGGEVESLDILYHYNGRERYYEQLGGAHQVAITFALKIGLSTVLQKMLGTEIKLLLLDEVDAPFDQAGKEAFSDIVRFFQKDFTILIITHDSALKSRFQDAILVEQDVDMISRAKIISNW